MEKRSEPNQKVMVVTRVVLCILILAIGVGAFLFFSAMKKPPKEAENLEKAIKVELQTARMIDKSVSITGTGPAKVKDMVKIAPEVGGKVVSVHPDLELGRRIPKGEILFEIDPVNYQAAYDVAAATVDQTRKTIERLKKQQAIDTERLATIIRNRDLARAEYERVRTLFEKNKVGTQSGVDKAESAYNQAVDQADQVGLAVDLYPIQIQETYSALESAKARLKTAKADLERTRVRAPFDGRVVSKNLEAGQFIQPGAAILTLADDSVLEIHVPIDSRDARDWLRFKKQEGPRDAAWFGALEQVPCEIRWTEDKNGHYWEGVLDRVVAFDNKTRTLTVSVKIPAEKALSKDDDQLPLVEGMFCSVSIPGKIMQGVVELPRWAVSFENTVYVANDKRLNTAPVKVVRIQGEKAYVSEGLQEGDQVIVTRLIDPLENSLLEVMNENKGDAAS
ncbi:RND family efflux transporter, MFP subunit [Desulfatibacillum alkenivorans DSM 16219]|jgi:RND family efflux transporter MFP subunit|uniref:RND family efflux transporter, MFP subunit n=1 Tax=Desulfatibacillum alkenivorans DSM 16219 TaxID=1121393 RepID=A0A1M6L2T4_9BACT|nr:efflux RND transporter periplasmic adaptor subunit [Desulfatibacillum alkenivorans]SHJ65531.1 RND family efflux transporter, MFP subunit [Desulfatibacillum alkenivorans DSM 16219]